MLGGWDIQVTHGSEHEQLGANPLLHRATIGAGKRPRVAGNGHADRRDITSCLGQGRLESENLVQEEPLRAWLLGVEGTGPLHGAAPLASPSGG